LSTRQVNLRLSGFLIIPIHSHIPFYFLYGSKELGREGQSKAHQQGGNSAAHTADRAKHISKVGTRLPTPHGTSKAHDEGLNSKVVTRLPTPN
jgi:hypothetical protein